MLSEVREHPELVGTGYWAARNYWYPKICPCMFPIGLNAIVTMTKSSGIKQYLTLVEDSEVSAEETSIRDILRLSENAMAPNDASSSSSDDESMEDAAVTKLVS